MRKFAVRIDGCETGHFSCSECGPIAACYATGGFTHARSGAYAKPTIADHGGKELGKVFTDTRFRGQHRIRRAGQDISETLRLTGSAGTTNHSGSLLSQAEKGPPDAMQRTVGQPPGSLCFAEVWRTRSGAVWIRMIQDWPRDFNPLLRSGAARPTLLSAL